MMGLEFAGDIPFDGRRDPGRRAHRRGPGGAAARRHAAVARRRDRGRRVHAADRAQHDGAGARDRDLLDDDRQPAVRQRPRAPGRARDGRRQQVARALRAHRHPAGAARRAEDRGRVRHRRRRRAHACRRATTAPAASSASPCTPTTGLSEARHRAAGRRGRASMADDDDPRARARRGAQQGRGPALLVGEGDGRVRRHARRPTSATRSRPSSPSAAPRSRPSDLGEVEDAVARLEVVRAAHRRGDLRRPADARRRRRSGGMYSSAAMAKRKRDYYEVLGVASATATRPRSSARSASSRASTTPTSTRRRRRRDAFREINEAYAVLSDREQRARYDRWGHRRRQRRAGFGAVVDAGAGDASTTSCAAAAASSTGRDLRYTLEVTFEEAAFGASKTIQVPDGDGAQARTREFTVVDPGRHQADGTVKMMQGRGRARQEAAPPGDLHVIVRVAEHPTFRRDGIDVRSEHAVTFTQAALGARDRRADARRPGQDAHPRGHPARPRVPHPRPRRPAGGRQERAARRSPGAGAGRGADRADAAPARADRGARARASARTSAARRRRRRRGSSIACARCSTNEPAHRADARRGRRVRIAGASGRRRDSASGARLGVGNARRGRELRDRALGSRDRRRRSVTVIRAASAISAGRRRPRAASRASSTPRRSTSRSGLLAARSTSSATASPPARVALRAARLAHHAATRRRAALLARAARPRTRPTCTPSASRARRPRSPQPPVDPNVVAVLLPLSGRATAALGDRARAPRSKLASRARARRGLFIDTKGEPDGAIAAVEAAVAKRRGRDPRPGRRARGDRRGARAPRCRDSDRAARAGRRRRSGGRRVPPGRLAGRRRRAIARLAHGRATSRPSPCSRRATTSARESADAFVAEAQAARRSRSPREGTYDPTGGEPRARRQGSSSTSSRRRNPRLARAPARATARRAGRRSRPTSRSRCSTSPIATIAPRSSRAFLPYFGVELRTTRDHRSDELCSASTAAASRRSSSSSAARLEPPGLPIRGGAAVAGRADRHDVRRRARRRDRRRVRGRVPARATGRPPSAAAAQAHDAATPRRAARAGRRATHRDVRGRAVAARSRAASSTTARAARPRSTPTASSRASRSCSRSTAASSCCAPEPWREALSERDDAVASRRRELVRSTAACSVACCVIDLFAARARRRSAAASRSPATLMGILACHEARPLRRRRAATASTSRCRTSSRCRRGSRSARSAR